MLVAPAEQVPRDRSPHVSARLTRRCRFRRLSEVEVVTPRGCWGLTSWTCTRRARPATTGGRAEDVRPKRHKAAIDGRERQRRNEGGKPRVVGEPREARRSRSRVARRLRTVLGALPGPAGRHREVSGGHAGRRGRFQQWFAGGVSAHELDDLVDVVVNLTYRTDRATVDAVHGRRLHAQADLT
jgi:hypothetical protein